MFSLIFGLVAVLAGFTMMAGAFLLLFLIAVSPFVLVILLIRAFLRRAEGKRSRVPILLAAIATVICVIVVLQVSHHTQFAFHWGLPDFGRKPPDTTSI